MSNQPKEYTEDHIKTLDGITGIRTRPTHYTQTLGTPCLFKMFIEIVTNSVDESRSRRCKSIFINIDTKTKEFTILDDGAGIPIGKIDEIVTNIHSGGKMDDKAYDWSAGLNGIGTTLVNALSKKFRVMVFRDGKRGIFEYQCGRKKSEKIEPFMSQNTRTQISFIADETVIDEYEIVPETFINHCEAISYINPGLMVKITIDGRSKEFYSENGLVDFLSKELHRHKLRMMCDTFYRATDRDSNPIMRIDALVAFNPKISGEYNRSFVNGLETIDHGTHVAGIKGAITMAIKRSIEKHSLLPKNSKLEISSDEIKDMLVTIVVADHKKPLFNSQTKEQLKNPDMMIFARTIMYQAMCKQFDAKPDVTIEICKTIIKLAKAKESARATEQNVLNTITARSSIFDRVDPDKLKECKSKDPVKRELFIIEGESAGSIANSARDKEHQASFYLRGKLQNVVKKDILSKELTELIIALGCGSGKKFDIKKIQYHKVVFMTDADSDGGHITSLLAGFFYTYYPELIAGGYIYTAKPPLYALSLGKKLIYVNDKEHLAKIIKKFGLSHFELIDKNQKKIKDEIFSIYIDRINTFAEEMDSFATWLKIDPVLLEYIAIHFDELILGKYGIFKEIDYEVKKISSGNNKITFEFDRNLEHSFLTIDSSFYKNVYLPIFRRLSEIQITGLFLRSKKTKRIYGGTTYQNSKLLSGIFEDSNSSNHVKRFKGLGEMQPSWLWDTALNPESRTLVQITMEDAAKAAEAMNIYMGKGIEEKKKLFAVTDE